MSGRRRRRVAHRLRLLFLLLLVLFGLRAVRASRERKTANCNNKYSHNMFPFSVLRLLEICTYSTLERSFSDAFGPTKRWLLASVRGSSALLSHSLEQHNCNRSSQVQTSRPVHRNSDAVINVGAQQILREAFRLAAKHEEIILLKSHFVIRPLAFCRQKKIARSRRLRPLQCIKGIPYFQRYIVPVVEPCSAQFSII